MADRLLVDLDSDGPSLSVGTWLDGELPQPGKAVHLEWPLDGDALEELRWYLEDYLSAPFGVYEDRGPQIQGQLVGWGSAVFSAVFGAGSARDAYVRARARQKPVQLVFRSSSPALLALPWELMADPDRPVPLALDLAGVSRSLPTADLADTFEVPGGRLRVLMVISRPAGTHDVGYRMIARPLLQRLEAVRGEVDLVVLRPPTINALAETLAVAVTAGEPFQVVHFDCHGSLRPAEEAVLAFESPRGLPHPVPVSEVAAVLRGSRVAVVVLNACQSGAIGRELEAAVATRLLQEGTASVVAMAYTVYAVAAAEFMAAFYEQLFVGDPVSAAVTAGRRRMFQADGRPSPKGKMPLADWLVPVHYVRSDVAFPHARTGRQHGLSLDAGLDRLRDPGTTADEGSEDLHAAGPFVGRDDLFFRLESAARRQRVVVLHGPGGTGKTELARAFGRWWRDTGGVENPDWVLWHSFEPGVASFGLDGVITQAGLRLFGADFARLEPAERRAVVERVLAQRRMLLIWDNFETVASMPDPVAATPALDKAGCGELREFLGRLAGGRSTILITSRTPEDWLGDVRRIGVGGLAPQEAAEYADAVLALRPAAAPRRAGRAFGELMQWLGGHPLSMRLTLPRLDTTDPEALLAVLRGTAALPSNDPGGDRSTSLAACVGYSYAHLAQETRQLLPAVCLFEGVADVNILAFFSQESAVPDRFAHASRDTWLAALDDAARTGLLTPLGVGTYQIHPALPGYLAGLWREEQPGGYDAARDAATRALAAACATLCVWLMRQIASGNAGMAYTGIAMERRTFGAMLGYALTHQVWDDAYFIGLTLDEYWEARGLDAEADRWADRVRLATEDPSGTPPLLDTPAGALWLLFAGALASRQQRQHRLAAAEHTVRTILDMLQAQPGSRDRRRQIATAHHELGKIVQDRGQVDEAEGSYRKSLAIEEELGDRPGMAVSYFQLGVVTQIRGQLVEADEWYRKSLAIFEEIGDRPRMAYNYYQLGTTAEIRGQLVEADEWCRQSLAIFEEIGDRFRMTASYHQLGVIAHGRGRLDEADEWYRKSLAISEDLRDLPAMTVSYHQLGITAQNRGRLDEAESWYRKSLAIKEELGDRPGMIPTFGQLGLLAEDRGQHRQALAWIIRCVALFEEFPHAATSTVLVHLARLTAQLGIGVLQECWREITGSPLPRAVRDYVESRSDPEQQTPAQGDR